MYLYLYIKIHHREPFKLCAEDLLRSAVGRRRPLTAIYCAVPYLHAAIQSILYMSLLDVSILYM